MKNKNKYSLGFLAFLQAMGLTAYCGLIAIVLWDSNQWFKALPTYFAPFLFLLLFTTSVLICALIALRYPFVLWQRKQTVQALRLLFYTACWSICITLIVLMTLFSR